VLRDGSEDVQVFDGEQAPVIRIPGPKRSFIVSVDGREARFRAVHQKGVTFLHVETSSFAFGDVEIEVEAPTGEQATFPVRFAPRPERLPDIEPIVKARTAGEFARAMALADEALRSEDRLVRVYAAIERGRIALRRGDHLEAVRLYREGAEIARKAGAITEVSARLDAAAYAALQARRFGLMKEIVDQSERAARESGDLYNRYTMLLMRAKLWSDLGDQRAAMIYNREAHRIIEHLGLERARLHSAEELATCLQRLGRFEEALATYPHPDAYPDVDPSQLARFEINLAWTEIRGIQAGALSMSIDSPRRRLERAIDLLEDAHEPARLANALCTLARVELEAGDLPRAESLIHRASTTHPPIFQMAHDCSFMTVEIHLAAGRTGEADRILSIIEQRMDETPPSDNLAAAPSSLRARIARARGRSDAVELHVAAFDVVAEMARRTPIQSGRGGFIAGKTTVVHDLIDLLLERGDTARAFSFADAANAMTISGLDAKVRLARLDDDARKEWAKRMERYHVLRDAVPRLRAECDRLPSAEIGRCIATLEDRRREVSSALDRVFELLDREAPAAALALVSPEEIMAALGDRAALLLVWGSGERRRSFLVDRDGVRHGNGAPELDAWIAPSVERLYVVGPWDPIEESRDGAELAARVGVAMLPSARLLLGEPRNADGPTVVVGDPTGDLPGARREAERIGSPGLLLVGAEAKRRDVLEAIDGAALFHFAGHARITGRSPWDSALSLSDGRITLEDLLIARPRVGVAVLSACESGTSRGEIGLPHAFLAAGARAVLATTRPLRDTEALPFLTRFYEHGGKQQPLEAFRAAIAASQKANDAAWHAFRLFGR
jgi:tetratricopeptide (TPR) repeat protein